jgi:hypothetical protein
MLVALATRNVTMAVAARAGSTSAVQGLMAVEKGEMGSGGGILGTAWESIGNNKGLTLARATDSEPIMEMF